MIIKKEKRLQKKSGCLNQYLKIQSWARIFKKFILIIFFWRLEIALQKRLLSPTSVYYILGAILYSIPHVFLMLFKTSDQICMPFLELNILLRIIHINISHLVHLLSRRNSPSYNSETNLQGLVDRSRKCKQACTERWSMISR